MAALARTLVIALGLLSFTFWYGVAMGQPAGDPPLDAAGAHVLFSEGRELMKQGEVARACSKFEESYRLRAGTGTLFNLADCWEKLGRTASAWAGFLDVAARAKRAGDTEREDMARERASGLVPKLAHLTIRAAAAPVPRIERNGVLVGPAMLGSSVPVDPGMHHISVTAPGKRGWETTLSVEPGAQLSLEIPPLQDAPREPPAKTAPRAAPVRSAAPELEMRSPAPRKTQRVLGYVLGGAGVVAIGTATFFGLRAISKNTDARGHCPGRVCRDENERLERAGLLDAAHSSRALSYTSLAIGVSALAGGTLLVLSAGQQPPSQARAPAQPQRAFVSVTGSF
jgi:hypothetical protein